ncbi:MAG: hypothetical protein JSU07_06220 [Bacteroidetes bacterium]|nr:hypothetical protein [Bacteroidota bacterium]
MKKTILFLFLFMGTIVFSQNNQQLNRFKKCSYSFTGELSSENKIKLEDSFNDYKEIKNAKVKYKPDNKSGEVVFEYIEPNATGEGDKNTFSIVSLKETIFKFNLIPLEFVTY